MGIDLTRDARSPALAFDLVRALKLLDNERSLAQIRSNEAFIPPSAVCSLQEATLQHTRSLLVRDAGIDLWFLQGVYRQDTARNLFLSYSSQLRGVSFGATDWEMDAARTFHSQRMPGSWVGEGIRELWIVGHSYGGMLAQCLAQLARRTLHATAVPIRVVTFGAPRVFDSEGAESFNGNVVHARWYNDNDPVRHLPPRGEEAPTLHAALTRQVSDRYNAFTHTSSGLCLRDSGVIERRADTPEIRPVAEASLLTWAAGIMDTSARDHQLSTYEDRLSRSLSLTQPVPVGLTNARLPQDTPMLPPATQGDEVVDNAAVYAVANARTLARRPRSTTTISRFRAAKRNGVWVVAWQDQTAVITYGKARARALARRANAMIRAIDPDDELAIMDVFAAVSRFA